MLEFGFGCDGSCLVLLLLVGLVGLIVSGGGFSLFRFLQFSVWFYGCS